MKALLGFRTVQTLAVVIAIGLVAAGCASTKNVMNKATFGLIGGSEKADATAEANDDSKEARKAREKEEKQQRDAEKRAAKDDAKARKAAANEEKNNEDKPGLMSRMTFGLVGGEKQADADKQIEADTKTAEKDLKRQDKEAREQEKRDAKAAKQQQEQEEDTRKKEEKLAAKERKEREKEVEKAETLEAQADAAGEKADEETSGKRSLMSRMTFGLVGGEKSGESDSSGKSEQSDQSAASTESAEPASDEASKAEKKAQERAEKEQRKADKQARKDAEKAEKQEAQQAEAQSNQAEAGAPDEQPGEKRTLMSRMTFGLVGGKNSDTSEVSDPSDASTSPSESTEPEQPALPPEQLAMAAPTDAQYDVQPASALDGDAQKLAKMPFKSTFDLSTKSASGKGQATAGRETYSKNGYGITDLGDVRIAVQGMTFDGESRAGGIVISSDDRAAVGGKSGVGNDAFIYEYAKGVTAVQFGTVNFTIAKSVISIGGKSVPIGQGKKLIVVDGQGNVIGAYSAE